MKQLICFCVLVLLAACQKIERPTKPEHLIPEDQMVDIFTEIYLFNAAKANYRAVLQRTGMSPEEMIYQKFGIDSVQFVESNSYYGADIQKYMDIHLRVQEKLETKKKEIENQINQNTEPETVTDSLQKRVRDSLNLEAMH